MEVKYDAKKTQWGPIAYVEPLEDGILRVTFKSGNMTEIDMKPRMEAIRFRPLKIPEVWKSADTNGGLIHWYKGGQDIVEFSWDEVIIMLEGR
ncbi:MAG: hypothetical protein Q4B48_07060 [Syntrophomonadaceae bacterium]|nr:hypothetical protein [Syntrophomonadaceae bacterium]